MDVDKNRETFGLSSNGEMLIDGKCLSCENGFID